MHYAAIAGGLVLLALVQAPAKADIYAFTDERGVTHFTNVPMDERYLLILESPDQRTRAGELLDPRLLARAADFDPIIERAARTHAVAADLLRAVIVVESGFNARAVSTRGARGLMQLMPATARQYGVSNAFDPDQNIAAGAHYLRDLSDRYENDLELVLAAYNAGERAVERYGRRLPPFPETRRYVPRVLGIYRHLLDLAASG